MNETSRHAVAAGDAAAEGDGGGRPQSAVAKAFRLLEIMLAADGPVAPAELARRAGLPKPSAHRLLVQLEEQGLVRRDPAGRGMTVGRQFTRLALAAVGRVASDTQVRGVMERLAGQVGECVNLAVLDGREVLYLERVECENRIRVHLQAGSRVPVHCTAVGKLFLAEMPAERRRAYLATLELTPFTRQTLTRPEVFEAAAERIRADGFSINREEFTEGLFGIAMPVRAANGQLLAGLSIHAPAFRMGEHAVARAIPRLGEAAQRIGRLLDDSG